MHPELACPRCRLALTVGRAGGRVVYGCVACAGAWLDLAQGEQLAQALDPEIGRFVEWLSKSPGSRRDTGPGIDCPVCRAPLLRYVASSQRIELDYCRYHGTWFDRDELARVAHALAVERAYNPARRGVASGTTSPNAGNARGGMAVGAAGAGVAPAGMTGVGMAGAGMARAGMAAAGIAAAGVAAPFAANAASHMLDGGPHARHRDEIVADVAETAAELPGEVALDGGFEAAAGMAEIGGAALGGVFELLGGIFDGLS